MEFRIKAYKLCKYFPRTLLANSNNHLHEITEWFLFRLKSKFSITYNHHCISITRTILGLIVYYFFLILYIVVSSFVPGILTIVHYFTFTISILLLQLPLLLSVCCNDSVWLYIYYCYFTCISEFSNTIKKKFHTLLWDLYFKHVLYSLRLNITGNTLFSNNKREEE